MPTTPNQDMDRVVEHFDRKTISVAVGRVGATAIPRPSDQGGETTPKTIA